MFNHILVPLDGSRLAESSLPAAVHLAKSGVSEVTLLHVVEGKPPSEVHGERHLTNAEEADSYLHSVAERYFSSDAQVSYHVHAEPTAGVARAIADHQKEFDHDLIVMCTHGRSGANTLVFGSIAQKICSIGTVPVLITQPDSGGAGSSRFETSPMLVPLDGTPQHESAVRAAVDFAEETRSKLHLLMVIPTLRTLPGKWEDATKILPTSAERLLAMAAEEAGEYLRQKSEEFRRRGLEVGSSIKRGDPAKVICESASESGAALLVLGTHGKSGLAAIWEGSVASRVLSRINLPVLLIPIEQDSP